MGPAVPAPEMHKNNGKTLARGLGSFFYLIIWADFTYQMLLGWLENVQVLPTTKLFENRVSKENKWEAELAPNVSCMDSI